jgi:hypothetical protein
MDKNVYSAANELLCNESVMFWEGVDLTHFLMCRFQVLYRLYVVALTSSDKK